MNIFYLDKDPITCAQMHCDKHVVKMIIELAQLLSTAHRVLDGEEYIDASSNRKIKRWRLNNSYENILYKATHVNHPSAVWVRESEQNYIYTYNLFVALCDEYTFRYNKVHMTDTKLRKVLATTPRNSVSSGFTQPAQAMPEHCKDADSVTAYRKYYILEKKDILSYKKRNVPIWIKNSNEDD